jgi:uncharacterized membrane protein YozB (DUF420 family)
LTKQLCLICNKMNAFVFALVVSAIITVCLLVTKHNENKEQNNSYGIKVFMISFFIVFVCHSYLMSGDTSLIQDIDVGEPPF